MNKNKLNKLIKMEVNKQLHYTHCCTELKSKENRTIPKVKKLDRLNLNDELM